MVYKKRIFKILISIITILSIVYSNINSIAYTEPEEVIIEQYSQSIEELKDYKIGSVVGGWADNIVGVLLLPAKAMIIIIGEAIRIILDFATGAPTIQKILFNKVPLTDINFFDYNSSSSEPAITAIKKNVATWYIGVRNIAAVLLVIVAMYVGLRMAVSTIAEERAKYKQMLIDWLVSLCLLFILHYIMIFVIQLNNTLVKTIGDGVQDPNLDDVARKFAEQAWKNVEFSKGMAEAWAFLLLEAMTLVYLISYIKRMITIAFLIIIAPLVTVTYSIDKMGDGRSQALNNWFKEFAYNILIQPFQCIAYLALCSTALEMVDNQDLKSALLAIILLIFLKTSENIIKHIFHFESHSMEDTFKNVALMSAAMRGFTNIGKSIASGGISAAGGGGSPSEKLQAGNREKALPTNRTDNSNIQTQNTVTDESIRAGASAAAMESTSDRNNSRDNNPNDAPFTQEAQQNDSSQPKSKKQIAGDIAKGFGRGAAKVLKTGAKYGLAANLAFLGTTVGAIGGAATGSPEALLTGALSGAGIGKGMGDRVLNGITNREIRNKTKNAIFDYRNQRGQISDAQLLKESMDLLDGTKEAKTDEERKLRDSLMKAYDRRIKLGDDEEAGLKNTEKMVKDLISNKDKPKRYFGKFNFGSTGDGTTSQPLTRDINDGEDEPEIDDRTPDATGEGRQDDNDDTYMPTPQDEGNPQQPSGGGVDSTGSETQENGSSGNNSTNGSTGAGRSSDTSGSSSRGENSSRGGSSGTSRRTGDEGSQHTNGHYYEEGRNTATGNRFNGDSTSTSGQPGQPILNEEAGKETSFENSDETRRTQGDQQRISQQNDNGDNTEQKSDNEDQPKEEKETKKRRVTETQTERNKKGYAGSSEDEAADIKTESTQHLQQEQDKVSNPEQQDSQPENSQPQTTTEQPKIQETGAGQQQGQQQQAPQPAQGQQQPEQQQQGQQQPEQQQQQRPAQQPQAPQGTQSSSQTGSTGSEKETQKTQDTSRNQDRTQSREREQSSSGQTGRFTEETIYKHPIDDAPHPQGIDTNHNGQE